MDRINIGLIGYGVVGQGVVKLLKKRKDYLKDKYNVEFILKTLCDRSVHKKNTAGLGRTKLTKNIDDVLNDKSIDVVIELIGGMNPARHIVETALKHTKHVITANKLLIANKGKELFQLARNNKVHLYFESSVGAGIPIISTIAEGMVGNKIDSIYGIINGTCNYILSQMTEKHCSFEEALRGAQEMGYAESNPKLDINGMDTAHKLIILTYLACGKQLKISDVYVEGITEISDSDIEHAESLNLSIKLLAIAKKTDKGIEARVHPTLISKDHPLASINGNYNAIYLHGDAIGNVLISGQGAGQMPAASGVFSDLINLVSRQKGSLLYSNIPTEAKNVKLQKIDDIKTKFYLRFIASDKPGILSKITGILGRYGISINSVTQKPHIDIKTAAVPVIMLTDYTTEKNMRLALSKIRQLNVVKTKPVAIRMEKLW